MNTCIANSKFAGSVMIEHCYNHSTMLVKLKNKCFPYFQDEHIYPLNKQVISLAKIKNKLIVPVSVPSDAIITRPTKECKFLSDIYLDLSTHVTTNQHLTINLPMINSACDQDSSFIPIAEKFILKNGSKQQQKEFYKYIINKHNLCHKSISYLKYLPFNIILDEIKCNKYLSSLIYKYIPKQYNATPYNYKELLKKYNVSLMDLVYINNAFAPFVEELLYKENKLTPQFYLNFIKYHKDYDSNIVKIFNKFKYITDDDCCSIVNAQAFNIKYVPSKKQTEELCWKALKYSGYSVRLIHPSALTLEMCNYAVQEDPKYLEYLPYFKQIEVHYSLKSTRC